MAVRPGEENVATLFGDVHYFYGPETDSPPHHRFDKGSYVYLFENAQERRARVEIANQPGTEDQDAFDGYLDNTHVRYSYKQSSMVTVIVNEVPNQEDWHLPTYDPRNENKYHYKLHSLDIYFWTPQDALQFVNAIRRVLPPSQVEVLDEPAPPPRHEPEVSSVVQQLEKAALSNSKPTPPGQAAAVPSFAPPPLSAVSADSSSTPPQVFVPMAYNPAAPAAPEAVRHREKTPPPEDGGVNPLHQTLAQDATTPFSPGLAPSGLGPLSPGIPPPAFHVPPGAPSFPAPPIHSVTSPGLPPAGFGLPQGFAQPQQQQQPSQHPGLARASTMPVHPGSGLASPGLASPFGGGYTPASPGFAPPPVAAHHSVPPPPAAQHTPTPPPPGGYSQYSYGSQAPGQGGDYSVHQQLYRPTEGEATVKYKAKQEPRGKLEENAGRLERGVSGMLKKFEKKFG